MNLITDVTIEIPFTLTIYFTKVGEIPGSNACGLEFSVSMKPDIDTLVSMYGITIQNLERAVLDKVKELASRLTTIQQDQLYPEWNTDKQHVLVRTWKSVDIELAKLMWKNITNNPSIYGL